MIHESLKEPEKIFTTFDKNLSSVNMITEKEWEEFRILLKHSDSSIKDVARAFATVNPTGSIFVEWDNGTLSVFIRLGKGDVRETFYNVGTWDWLNDEYK